MRFFFPYLPDVPVFREVLLVFLLVLQLVWLYDLLIGLRGFRKATSLPGARYLRRFAVVVPAHNEERVLGGLLQSLAEQDYPRELIDVYVSCDNCSDRTPEVAARFDRRVLLRRDEGRRGKTWNVRWALRQIDIEQYEAISILDADNVVRQDYFSRMNDFLDAHPEAQAVQGYLDIKNPHDSWVTRVYAVAYWYTNRFWQLARSRWGLSAQLGGTGWVIRTQCLKRLGWELESLTEDLEFTTRLILTGDRVHWNEHAVIFDEKPIRMRASRRQRTRWIQGHYWVMWKYGARCFRKFLHTRRLQYLDTFIYLVSPGRNAVSFLVILTGLWIIGYQFFTSPGDLFTTNRWWAWGTWAMMILVQATMVCVLGPSLHLKRLTLRYLNWLLLYIWYGLTWGPIMLHGLVLARNQQTWIKTEHTRNLAVRDVRTARLKRRPRIHQVAVRVLATTLILGAFMDSAYVATELPARLRTVRLHMRRGAQYLSNAATDQAVREFAFAKEEAVGAKSITAHPMFTLAEAVPGIRRDAAALNALSASGLASARGAEFLAHAVDRWGIGESGQSDLYSNGRLNLTVTNQLRLLLPRVKQLLNKGMAALGRPLDPSFPELRDALEAARREIMSADQMVARTAVLARVFPRLLGRGERKDYLLALQSPSEARGSGGIVGVYSVLSVRKGRFNLRAVQPYDELRDSQVAPRVQAPLWFEERYEALGGLSEWQQANLSPQFPTVAKVLLQMFKHYNGDTLDGVIAVDPYVLREIATVSNDPIRVRGFSEEITRGNAIDLLLGEGYVRFTRERQDQYLRHLAKAVWREVKYASPSLLVRAAAKLMASGHVKVYTNDSVVQEAMKNLGVAGDIHQLGPNVQMVFHNNAAANKVDYFLHRTIKTDVQFQRSGDATVTTDVILDNTSPAGPASGLIGPGITGDQAGLNRMYLNVLMPRDAKVSSLSIDGKRRSPLVGNEAGYPVVWDVLEIPPGRSSQVQVRYRLKDAFENGRFSLTLAPQTAVRSDGYSLIVHFPEGSGGSLAGETGSVRIFKKYGRLPQNQRFDFQLRSAPDRG